MYSGTATGLVRRSSTPWLIPVRRSRAAWSSLRVSHALPSGSCRASTPWSTASGCATTKPAAPVAVDDPLEETWQAAAAVRTKIKRELGIGAYVIPVAMFPDMSHR